jgi:integrase
MPETMRWLCQQYYASSAFQLLAPSTRKVRRKMLEEICQRCGNFPFATMEARHVAKMRDEKTAFPEGANHRVKALRQLFAWASSPEYRYATKNPAREVAYLRSNNPDGIRAWSEADAARYEARHPIGTKARLAFDLLLYTGVRRSDAVRLGPQMERDGKLVFSETKGSTRIAKTHELPILPPLRRSIDATPTGHLVYLMTATGQPQSAHGFGTWFSRRCREAGLALSAHGLRKRAAGPDRLIPPAMQQGKQPFWAWLELVARLTLNAGKHTANKPARVAQLDDRNDRAILVQGDEGSAQVVRLGHRGSPLLSRSAAALLSAPAALLR